MNFPEPTCPYITAEIKGCEDMHCLDQVEEITVHETVEIMEGTEYTLYSIKSS